MKKYSLSIVVGIFAFALGIVLVLLLQEKWISETPSPAYVSDPAQIMPAESKPVTCKESPSYPGLSVSIAEKQRYKNGFFPEDAFDDGWSDADGSANKWYGKFLGAMGERSLFDEFDNSTEIYRFLWLRTFHHPIAVRVEREGYSFKLVSVELSGMGGYEPGQKIRTDNVSISAEEWCEFMSLLEAASFWSQPTVSGDRPGHDGSQWILEGVRRNRYHIIDRWSPREGEYRAACIYLLKLSGRDVEKMGSDIY